MKTVLVFGGTSDTHLLLEALEKLPCSVTVCVASDYGKSMLPEEHAKLSILVGRLDAIQIEELLVSGGYCCIVDATHPYATEVTANIRTAAEKTGTSYFRLLREQSDSYDVTTVSSAADVAELLKKTLGNVLLTTGSKDLAIYTTVPDYTERLYPRVLPSVESIETCLTLGYQVGHILAIQGPFSKELNVALMRQFNIDTLVTKDGGRQGGFPEKFEAAKTLGAQIIVIRRPADDGLSQSEIIYKLTKLLEADQ